MRFNISESLLYMWAWQSLSQDLSPPARGSCWGHWFVTHPTPCGAGSICRAADEGLELEAAGKCLVPGEQVHGNSPVTGKMSPAPFLGNVS